MVTRQASDCLGHRATISCVTFVTVTRLPDMQLDASQLPQVVSICGGSNFGHNYSQHQLIQPLVIQPIHLIRPFPLDLHLWVLTLKAALNLTLWQIRQKTFVYFWSHYLVLTVMDVKHDHTTSVFRYVGNADFSLIVSIETCKEV